MVVDFYYAVSNVGFGRVDHQVGIRRCFVRAVDPRHIGQLPTAGLFVQAFRITLLAYFQRRVYKHFDEVGGISFLPYSEHSYQQAPYQPISEQEYNEWCAKTPKIDWSGFNVDEHEDKTEGAQQMACAGGTCEL